MKLVGNRMELGRKYSELSQISQTQKDMNGIYSQVY